MATPTVRRTRSRSSQGVEQNNIGVFPLKTRRFLAWTAEITIVVVSSLIPFGIGAYTNAKSDMNRVPLNPLVTIARREVARPLALPVSLGVTNVAWATNILWTLGLITPLAISGWQLYLLAKTGSTTPKRWFAVKVINQNGGVPGFQAVLVRESIGRWCLPVSVAYLLWRNSLLFPNFGVFTILVSLMMLGESSGFPWQKQRRRALHDSIAGTYTIDANQSFTPDLLDDDNTTGSKLLEDDEEAAIESIVITPEPRKKISLWRRMRQNPSLTLFLVSLISISAVLTTLILTQVYIQAQKTRRAHLNVNVRQLNVLREKLSPESNASLRERQQAILALGSLNNEQATKYLVSLLIEEREAALLNTVERSLELIGPKAIPHLLLQNRSLVNELDLVNDDTSSNQESRKISLHNNQKAINRILGVYNGQTNGIDLNRVNLGQSGSGETSFFNLVLDKVDLWGINFKSANLNQASFQGSRFRGPGEDGRWNTFDDWIADLSQAELKKANLSNANLSRVLMNRADLSRANLQGANLFSARLVEANLSSARLPGADLRRAVLENASLTGADLGDAKLNDADLFSARLGRVIATGAHFSFANLTKTDWQGADLSSTDFQGANLSDANLSATRLTSARLRNVNLQNANLRNANLQNVDLRGANVAGADFQGAIFSPQKQNPSEQFVQTPATGTESAVVKGVDFSQVKNSLDSKQLAYICTQGGVHPRCP